MAESFTRFLECLDKLQLPYAAIQAGIVTFMVALPAVIAISGWVHQHRTALRKNPKLSFVYKWQHSGVRMLIVKTIESLFRRNNG